MSLLQTLRAMLDKHKPAGVRRSTKGKTGKDDKAGKNKNTTDTIAPDKKANGKEASGAGKPPAVGTNRSFRVNLLTLSIVPFVGVFFITVTLLVLFLGDAQETLRGEKRAMEALALDTLSGQFGVAVQQRKQWIKQLSLDADVIDAFARGPAVRQRAQDRLTLLLGDAMRVRLLDVGFSERRTEESPPIGLGVIEMVARAEANNLAPGIEVHFPGGASEHINFLQPVTRLDGTLVGHILVSFRASLFHDLIENYNLPTGYASLIYIAPDGAPFELAGKGDRVLKKSICSQPAMIEGTPLGICYFTDKNGGVIASSSVEKQVVLFVVYGVILFVLCLVPMLITRWLIRKDGRTFVSIMEDLQQRDIRSSYPAHTIELAVFMRRLHELALDFIPPPPGTTLIERAARAEAQHPEDASQETNPFEAKLVDSSEAEGSEHIWPVHESETTGAGDEQGGAVDERLKASVDSETSHEAEFEDNLYQTLEPESNDQGDGEGEMEMLEDIDSMPMMEIQDILRDVSLAPDKSAPLPAQEDEVLPVVRKPQTEVKSVTPVLLPAEIFRAYDIRGIVDKSLTDDTVRLIAQAIGTEAISLGHHAIIVCRDGRLSGPRLLDVLIDGLKSTGLSVINIGAVPTPVMYFSTFALGTRAGVALTGSHNPKDFNGLKIMLGGKTLAGEAIQKIRRIAESRNFAIGNGKVREQNMVPEYLDRIIEDVSLLRPMKIVVDCGNGVAAAVAPKLFQALGCSLEIYGGEIDGNFPNHHPDPSVPKNYEALINLVKIHQADLGIAFDGDGDRLGIVDSKGRIIWPDRLMMLFARDVLARNPGKEIIFDVKCTQRLSRVISEYGGIPVMWKTGHSLMKSKLLELDAPLAGEMSGHIFFSERWYGFDDALYAASRLLEILSADDRSSAAVFDELPDGVSTPELKAELKEGEAERIVEEFLTRARFPAAKITSIDGLRADFVDGWGLARPSNTTPSLVFRFDADNEAALARIQDDFRKQILAISPALKLPF